MPQRKIDLRDWMDPVIGEVPNSNGFAITWPANRLMHVDTCSWVGDVPVDPDAWVDAPDGTRIRADVSDARIRDMIAEEFEDEVEVDDWKPSGAPQGAGDGEGDPGAGDDGEGVQNAFQAPQIEDLGLPTTVVDAIRADERGLDVDALAGLALADDLTSIPGVGAGNAAKIAQALVAAGFAF